MSFISNIKKIINISGKSESSQIPKTEERSNTESVKKEDLQPAFPGSEFYSSIRSQIKRTDLNPQKIMTDSSFSLPVNEHSANDVKSVKNVSAVDEAEINNGLQLKVERSLGLDEYVVNKNKTYLAPDEFFRKIDFFSNPNAKYAVGDWSESLVGKDNNQIAWKMHLYSDDLNDFQDLFEVVSPYLIKHKINHKIIGINNTIDILNSDVNGQKGKAFTIYPSSIEEMRQIAVDLDYIIRKNGLELKNSKINGDNNLGDTGRIFYRYELNSGKYKDIVFNTNGRISEELAQKYGLDANFSNGNMFKIYRYKLYDPNRGNNNYLPADMTVSDDIWAAFNPSTGRYYN